MFESVEKVRLVEVVELVRLVEVEAVEKVGEVKGVEAGRSEVVVVVVFEFLKEIIERRVLNEKQVP